MMTQKFIDAIEAGNLISVRYSLSNELLLDPRGDSYREMKAMAEERLDGLYEPLEGALPQKVAEDFTEAELMEVKNDLDANFAKERLAFYEQAVAVVLRDKAEQMAHDALAAEENIQAEDANGSKQKCQSKCRGKVDANSGIMPATVGLVAGLAVGGIAKAFRAASAVAAGVAVTAGVATGAAVKYLKDNDREDEEL